MSPQRIQRQRTKGWRMPEGAIYVGRPGRYGNPHRVGTFASCDCIPGDENDAAVRFTPESAVEAYRAWLVDRTPSGVAWLREHVAPLRGHDLACWCPLDQPCHADVLLELANR